MATNVDIANLALAHLGDSARLSSLDEASAQAQHANRFFPIARASLLTMHPWKFATRRLTPAQLSSWDDDAWAYAYHEPNMTLKVLAAFPDGYTNDLRDGVDFITESNEAGDALILTKVEITKVKVIQTVTDPAKFSPLFTEALAWLLASYMAGPLLKGESGRQAALACWATFLGWFGRAAQADASQSNLPAPERIPPWLQRGRDPSTEGSPWPESYPVRE